MLWKQIDSLNSETRSIVSTSRVTLLSNLRVPGNAKDNTQILKKYAKL